MFTEKIESLIDYCKSKEYHIKVAQKDENLHRISVANKYLQKMEFKVINGSQLRILSHENTRFAQEILETIDNLRIETVSCHYDHIITPDVSAQMKEENRETKCRMEFEMIAAALDALNPHDEVKIYTSSKGLISILKDFGKIQSKYPGTPYEQIYNIIKEKKLMVHFEWIRKTPPRRKPKRGKKAPVVSKKVLVH